MVAKKREFLIQSMMFGSIRHIPNSTTPTKAMSDCLLHSKVPARAPQCILESQCLNIFEGSIMSELWDKNQKPNASAGENCSQPVINTAYGTQPETMEFQVGL